MINLDHRDRRPLYMQIISQIEDLALHGVLQPGQQLPSLRSLAMDLSINPNTIQRAYMELESKGVIYSVPGKGSFLGSDREKLISGRREAFYKDLAELIKMAVALQIEKADFLAACDRLYSSISSISSIPSIPSMKAGETND